MLHVAMLLLLLTFVRSRRAPSPLHRLSQLVRVIFQSQDMQQLFNDSRCCIFIKTNSLSMKMISMSIKDIVIKTNSRCH